MPGGRPTKYTNELGDKICESIAKGISLAKMCKQKDMPEPRSVYRWRREIEEFSHNYDKAREDQADYMVEEILDIADNDVETPVIVDGVPIMVDGKVVMTKDAVGVSHAKLRVDTRKWAASKFKPNRYADKVQQEISGANGGPVVIEEIRRVLSKKKPKKLSDFFGLLSKEVGEPMIKDYKRIRRDQIKLTKERLKAINR